VFRKAVVSSRVLAVQPQKIPRHKPPALPASTDFVFRNPASDGVVRFSAAKYGRAPQGTKMKQRFSSLDVKVCVPNALSLCRPWR
jgi:hypothetical protein